MQKDSILIIPGISASYLLEPWANFFYRDRGLAICSRKCSFSKCLVKSKFSGFHISEILLLNFFLSEWILSMRASQQYDLYSFCRNFFVRKHGIRKFCPKIWWCGWKGRKKDPPATSPKHSLTFSLKTATRFYHKMNQFQNITEFCLDFCYFLIEYIFNFDRKYFNKYFIKWIY